MLAMHPEYQQQVFDEVLNIIPEQMCDVTAEHIGRLDFTNRFIKETMRLMPTVPFVSRIAKQDFEISKCTPSFDPFYYATNELILAVCRWRDNSSGHRIDDVHLHVTS